MGVEMADTEIDSRTADSAAQSIFMLFSPVAAHGRRPRYGGT